VKATGNIAGLASWTAAIVAKTERLEKVKGPCIVRVTFRLPREKFHNGNPYGNDIDNLLKRLFDALSKTVFSEVPGRDACVVSVEATKVLVMNPMEAGVDGEIIEVATPNNALEQTRDG
jgi:Holliday junction resolvase RusA-like endonuclease